MYIGIDSQLFIVVFGLLKQQVRYLIIGTGKNRLEPLL